MHSATDTTCGATSWSTLTIGRSLRLSALGSVMNANSSSVNSSSCARKLNRLDIEHPAFLCHVALKQRKQQTSLHYKDLPISQRSEASCERAAFLAAFR